MSLEAWAREAVQDTQVVHKRGTSTWQRVILHLARLTLVLALALICELVFVLRAHERVEADAAIANGRRTLIDAAQRIGGHLAELETIPRRIARELNEGSLPVEELAARLLAEMKSDRGFFEIGVAYVAGASGQAPGLWAPHVAWVDGKATPFQLGDRYDYSTYEWFNEGLAAGARWGEPYIGKALPTPVVGFTTPLWHAGDPERGAIGLVRITLAIADGEELVSALHFGRSGHAFLLSRKGTYLADPEAELVTAQREITAIARERDDEARRRIGARALSGEAGECDGVDGASGRALRMLVEPIPVAGWSIGAVLFQDEFSLPPRELRRSLMRIGGAAMILCFVVALLVFRGHLATPRSLLRMSVSLSLLLLAGIYGTWWLALELPDGNAETGVPIYEARILRAYLAEAARENRSERREPPIPLPTGLIINTLSFAEGNEVAATGLVWQRYAIGGAPALSQGVVFLDATACELRESYRRREDAAEIVGWHFRVALRQNFEHATRYPFDRGLIRLRLGHPDLDRRVMLTPDLGAYQVLTPSRLPGIKQGLVAPGWQLIESFFSYTRSAYGVDFGIAADLKHSEADELCFSVAAQRHFLNPFISSVLPVFVVACLLFALLMVGSKDRVRTAVTGYKVTDVLRGCISLLFPVLLAQVHLRSKIGAATIIYVEYFYFVMYTAVLGVAGNSLIFTLRDRGLSQIGDNALPKLLFWPLLLGAFFGVTIQFLY